MANDNGRLLSLPPELRNRIWDLVLTCYPYPNPQVRVNKSGQAPKPALLRVCQSIRADSLPMWYARSCFHIPVFDTIPSFESALRWLESIDAAAQQCIRQLSLCVRLRSPYGKWTLYYSFRVDAGAVDPEHIILGLEHGEGSAKALRDKLREVVLSARIGNGRLAIGVDDWSRLIRAIRGHMLEDMV